VAALGATGLLPGELNSYLLHMPPCEWPIMAGHTLLGYVLAVGVQEQGAGSTSGRRFAPGHLGVFLNGGTLAIIACSTG